MPNGSPKSQEPSNAGQSTEKTGKQTLQKGQPGNRKEESYK